MPAPASSPSCCTPRKTSPEAGQDRLTPSPAEGTPSILRPELADSMVHLPAATFLMGTDNPEAFPADGEGPVREVTLSAFAIDRYPVTNQLFARFCDETGYVTDAETFGWSFVFWAHIPPPRFRELVADTVAGAEWWCQVPGACWRTPEGPGSGISTRHNHPAVHISWQDARAFCAWSGQRLPTEAEWEYAARGGLVQKLYPWGDTLQPEGRHRCNIWQGDFPRHDTAEDGYAGTAPVDAYSPNGFGLHSITGNTWEWCADWFSATHHLTASPDAVRVDPSGPPAGAARVMKGGSFLCHSSYCNRYRVAARSSNTPDSSASNMGFRCVHSA